MTSGPSGTEGGDLARIREVKARHEGHLLSMAGVVSVGLGKDPDGRPSIVVGLDRPRPEGPPEIPGELEGFPVRVEIVGRPRALGESPRRSIKP